MQARHGTIDYQTLHTVTHSDNACCEHMAGYQGNWISRFYTDYTDAYRFNIASYITYLEIIYHKMYNYGDVCNIFCTLSVDDINECQCKNGTDGKKSSSCNSLSINLCFTGGWLKFNCFRDKFGYTGLLGL